MSYIGRGAAVDEKRAAVKLKYPKG